ncbi:MAG: hypothetical protein P4M05_28185 [Bradyrhizobium sp.]|nr:hypothetical protein [Bradyrhizobium sp.]
MDKSTAIAAMESDYRIWLWNQTIPKRAIHIEVGETHTTYVHPTKGPRRISNKRLGL